MTAMCGPMRLRSYPERVIYDWSPCSVCVGASLRSVYGVWFIPGISSRAHGGPQRRSRRIGLRAERIEPRGLSPAPGLNRFSSLGWCQSPALSRCSRPPGRRAVVSGLPSRSSTAGGRSCTSTAASASAPDAARRDDHRLAPRRPGAAAGRAEARGEAARARRGAAGTCAAASDDGARPGASQRPQRGFRREGVRARQERVSAEIARGYGLEADPDDAIPF